MGNIISPRRKFRADRCTENARQYKKQKRAYANSARKTLCEFGYLGKNSPIPSLSVRQLARLIPRPSSVFRPLASPWDGTYFKYVTEVWTCQGGAAALQWISTGWAPASQLSQGVWSIDPYTSPRSNQGQRRGAWPSVVVVGKIAAHGSPARAEMTVTLG